MAALEAKLAQYERDMRRLKKALERSDEYIEELQEQTSRNPKVPTERDSNPEQESEESTPPTPSSALRGLNLNSPAGSGTLGVPRLPYLRRLSFVGCGRSTAPSSAQTHGSAPGLLSSAEELRMDAAFLDKVSELDCMMAEGESSRGGTGVVLRATPEPESSGGSGKRKCPPGVVMSSPSKVSKSE